MTIAPFPFPTEPRPVGWVHILYFGLIIPFAVWRNRRKFSNKNAPLPARLQFFQKSAASVAVLALFSFAVAHANWIFLFPLRPPRAFAVLSGLILYAVMVAFMYPRWRKAVKERNRVAYLFMPGTGPERAWWITLSFAAGIGEEITWRGVQTALLMGMVGNYWIASIVSAISFALAHAIQGRRSVTLIGVVAVAFQGLVWLSGSLYVAMMVHVAYDITAGLAYGKLGKQVDYSTEPGPPQDQNA